jgi:hypothetical protein
LKNQSSHATIITIIITIAHYKTQTVVILLKAPSLRTCAKIYLQCANATPHSTSSVRKTSIAVPCHTPGFIHPRTSREPAKILATCHAAMAHQNSTALMLAHLNSIKGIVYLPLPQRTRRPHDRPSVNNSVPVPPTQPCESQLPPLRPHINQIHTAHPPFQAPNLSINIRIILLSI